MNVSESLGPLEASLKIVAETELNEVENRLPEDIETLRKWIEKQPHIKARLEIDALICFLRGCKHSMEKAKIKTELFYTMLQFIPEVRLNLEINDKCLDICHAGIFLVLPRPLLQPAGPRIYLTRLKNLNIKVHHLNDLYRYVAMVVFAQGIQDANSTVSGLISIMDIEKISLTLLKQLDLILLRKLIVLFTKGFPVRIKGLHIINLPNEAFPIWQWFKALIDDKLKERIHLHRTMEDLYKMIPQQYLPVEYGGTNGSAAEITNVSERALFAFKDEFAKIANYGIDEKFRSNVCSKTTDANKLFGLEGSFRKLQID